MRTLVGVGSLEPSTDGCAVTIGTFDGVHLGHRSLIARAVSEARERGIESAVVSWDRHPMATLRPDKAPRLLTSPERKAELLAERGIDVLAVLPFDAELSQWPPERFASDVLAKGLGARHVFVGRGWRFGHKAAGDVDLLTELGTELGFEVDAIDLAAAGESKISSSRIRKTIADGDMELAAELLGRPFDVDGTVEHGDDRGKDLGYPTANLDLDPALAEPPRGVYAGRARVKSSWFKAAVNVGVNPTFGGDPASTPIRVEAYLLDFEGDIYGETLRVEFWKRLRDELRFESVPDLVAQMARDVELTRSVIPG